MLGIIATKLAFDATAIIRYHGYMEVTRSSRSLDV
jgi:hypothetical protein